MPSKNELLLINSFTVYMKYHVAGMLCVLAEFSGLPCNIFVQNHQVNKHIHKGHEPQQLSKHQEDNVHRVFRKG